MAVFVRKHILHCLKLIVSTWVRWAKVAHLGGECGENAAAKSILCDSFSVLIQFSVTLYITYHGIND